MITCVTKIKEGYTIQDVAREVWEVLGEGGNPQATIPEEYVGFVNTPIQDGWIRATFDEKYIPYLLGIKEIDGVDSAEIVDVEMNGQKDYIINVVPELTLEDGTIIPPRDEMLGYISGIPFYTEPIIEKDDNA